MRMAAINVIAADTDDEARHLFKSLQQQFINLRRGVPSRLQPPDDVDEGGWTDEDRFALSRIITYSVVGSPATVRAGIDAFLTMTGVDELMITAHVFDHAARLRSFELVAGVRDAG